MVRRRVRPQPPRPGPATRAHPVQLADMAPPEAAQEGAQSLPSRRRGVDGALTVPPRARAVPPVRNTSASSMQSPPASADATRVIILSPVFGPPRGIAQVEALPDEFGQAQAQGEGGRQDQPGIGHQAMIVEGDHGCGRGSGVVAS